VVQLGPKAILATFGELHPETLSILDVDGPAAAFEVYLDAIPPSRRKGAAKGPLVASGLQPVRRDFAFLVGREVEASAVLKAVETADKALVSRASVFDVFEGHGVAQGKKSLGIEVTLQPTDRTLTDAEIEAVSTKIVRAVAAACGAELRG
jgi:phenylalanyl-tRNA synthetase beta chain